MSDDIRMEYCFTWKIENYSLRVRNTELESPIFAVDNFHGSKWFMRLNPSYIGEGKEHISCFLYRSKVDLYDEDIAISFIVEAIYENGKTVATRGSNTEAEMIFRGKGRGWFEYTPLENATSQCLTWKKDILTIRCRMFTTLKRPESVALTEIGIDKFSFHWKVKFQDCVASSQAKKFSLSETSQYEISATAANDSIEIKVIRADKDTSFPRLLRGNIILLNQEDVKVLSKSAKHLFDSTDDNHTWNFPSLNTKKQLEDNKNNYLKNDTFSLLSEFSAANGKESSNILSRTSCFKNQWNSIMNLHDDLSNLFESGKHSDLELLSENNIFSAHKSILGARSPVFSAMFDQDMIENQSGAVDIPDVDPVTLRSFLEFIYSGTVNLNDYENALKLLMVADKYQVHSLKEICSMFLMSSFSLENACEILDMADVLNLKQLKKCALDYFAKHMKEIWNLPQWLEFTEKNAKLSIEIFSHIANNFEILPKKN